MIAPRTGMAASAPAIDGMAGGGYGGRRTVTAQQPLLGSDPIASERHCRQAPRKNAVSVAVVMLVSRESWNRRAPDLSFTRRAAMPPTMLAPPLTPTSVVVATTVIATVCPLATARSNFDFFFLFVEPHTMSCKAVGSSEGLTM